MNVINRTRLCMTCSGIPSNISAVFCIFSPVYNSNIQIVNRYIIYEIKKWQDFFNYPVAI